MPHFNAPRGSARFLASPRARRLLPLLIAPLACQEGAPTPELGDPATANVTQSRADGPSLAVRPGKGKPGPSAAPSVPPLSLPSDPAAGPPAASLPPPLPPLAEQDATGAPVLYYGRVRITDPAQPKLLKVLGFVKDIGPFFDDYNPREVRRAGITPSTEQP